MAVQENNVTDAIVVESQANPERFLTPREKAAYDFTVAHRMPDLSPASRAKLFALFLQGTDCVEISRLNPGITLGQVVRVRLDDGWDEKRREHIAALLSEVRVRLQQTTLESVEFVSNLLAATHKQYGDQLKKYLMTGDPADLGTFGIHGLRQYREAIQLLRELSGQDDPKTKKQSVTGEVIHTHRVEGTTPANRGMTNEEARTVIGTALAIRRGK